MNVYDFSARALMHDKYVEFADQMAVADSQRRERPRAA